MKSLIFCFMLATFAMMSVSCGSTSASNKAADSTDTAVVDTVDTLGAAVDSVADSVVVK